VTSPIFPHIPTITMVSNYCQGDLPRWQDKNWTRVL